MILAAAWACPALAGPAKVCPDPAKPCAGFKAHDLSFPLLADGVARDEQRSAPFYAVILVSGAACRVTERQRSDIQALFPRHKVFSYRHCEDAVEENVSYSNVDSKRDFVAVYAGEDRAAGEEMLVMVKSMNRFAGANIRRMEVIYGYP